MALNLDPDEKITVELTVAEWALASGGMQVLSQESSEYGKSFASIEEQIDNQVKAHLKARREKAEGQ